MSESPRFHRLREPGVRVAPSLLAADFSRLGTHVAAIEAAGVTLVHLDVMDGHFVPNISFGPPVIESLRPTTDLVFDAHLMIEEPARYAESFARAGCDLITFHIEVTDQPAEVVRAIRDLNLGVGVSLNPTTPAESIRSIVKDVDLVLVMSVWPGFGGQSFIADVLEKVGQLSDWLEPWQRLEIDGGIDHKTVARAVAAGADTLVAGTAVFRAEDPTLACRELQRIAQEAA